MKLKHVSRVKTGSPLLVCFDIPTIQKDEYTRLVKGNIDGTWDVEIVKHRKRRSTGFRSASAHFNGHCQQIAEATGNDFADVKLYIKRQAVKRGLPLKTRPDGSMLLSLSDGEPVPISEADMDSLQCSWCIDEAHILAGELQVVLVEE